MTIPASDVAPMVIATILTGGGRPPLDFAQRLLGRTDSLARLPGRGEAS